MPKSPALWLSCLIAGSLASMTAAAVAAPQLSEQEQTWHTDAHYLSLQIDRWEVVDGKLTLANHTAAACDEHLARIERDHAPDSVEVELEHDAPGHKAGKYPWAEARVICAELHKQIDRWKKVDIFLGDVRMCESDNKAQLQHIDYFQNCMKDFDAAVVGGIPTDEPVQDMAGKPSTIQGLRDAVCAPGLAKLQAKADEHAAPFKKLLKNDKLKIALRDEGFIWLPGKAKFSVEALAANSVWFEDASPSRRCPNGAQVHVLHRYTFNGAQKLAGTTDRQFCGNPPSSAFH